MNSLGAVTFATQAFVTLFVIMDPPGATPIFLGLVGNKPQRERVRLAWQAGGLLLLYVALQLLTGNKNAGTESSSENIGMVPLGTPLLAGPGAIVATMIYVQKADTHAQIIGLVIAILAVHLIIGTVLMASTKIVTIIKESGVTLLASIAGLLLAAIAVQMLANAIKVFAAN